MTDDLLAELETLLVEAMAGSVACARRRATCSVIYVGRHWYADLLHVERDQPPPWPRRTISVASLLGGKRGELTLQIAAWLQHQHPDVPLRDRADRLGPADPVPNPFTGRDPVPAGRSGCLGDSVRAGLRD